MAPRSHTAALSERCHRIFAALDGHDFVTADARWQLEVFSVVQQGANLWIQLRLAGQRPTVLTLCLSRNADARDVLEALSLRMAEPRGFQSISNVA